MLRSSSRLGFSLLELIVVLVLVALISAMVVMRWSGVQHRAVTKSAVSQLEFLDQHMRSFARMQRTHCSLTFKIDENLVRKFYDTQATTQNRANPAWQSLGRGVQIKKLQTTGHGKRKKLEEVAYRPDGTSSTYVVHLACPGKRQVWLVFAGVSGKMVQLETEREADAALAVTNPAKRL